MNRVPPKLLLVIVLGIETVVSGWAIVGPVSYTHLTLPTKA